MQLTLFRFSSTFSIVQYNYVVSFTYQMLTIQFKSLHLGHDAVGWTLSWYRTKYFQCSKYFYITLITMFYLKGTLITLEIYWSLFLSRLSFVMNSENFGTSSCHTSIFCYCMWLCRVFSWLEMKFDSSRCENISWIAKTICRIKLKLHIGWITWNPLEYGRCEKSYPKPTKKP